MRQVAGQPRKSSRTPTGRCLKCGDPAVDGASYCARCGSPDGPPVHRVAPGLALSVALLVAGISAVAFWPAVEGKWINKDDDVNFTNNEQNLGFGRDQLRWMFTTSHIGVYTPISWLTVAVDYELAKRADPQVAIDGLDHSVAAERIFHRTNVLFHAANSALFFLIALALLTAVLRPSTRSDLRAVLAVSLLAGLFHALHPLRAQTVAWASARNNLVGAFFFLIAVLCHLRAHGGRCSRRRLWGMGGAFAYILAALAKATTLPLPMLLLILDWYPLRRFGPGALKSDSGDGWRRVMIEKIPYLLLAGVVVVVTYLSRQGLFPPELSPLRKLGIASFGVLFYPLKTLIPAGLSPYYPIPLEPSGADQLMYVLGGIFGVVATIGAMICFRRRPAITAAWASYLLLIGLLLGLISTGTYVAADRYSYLAAMPFALLLAGGVYWVWRRMPRLGAVWALLMVAVLAGCTLATRQQIAHWRTPVAVWSRILEVFPREHLAQLQLGNAYFAAGDEERARASYLAAADGAGRSSRPMVRTRRYCSKARANLAVLHAAQGRLRSAMEQFQLAITEDPQQMTARLNLAEMLISIGELGESLKLCAQSLQLPSPEDPGIHDDFRRIQRYLLQYRNREREAYDHARGGRLDEAQRILEEEIERFASNPVPYLKLADFYLQSSPKRYTDAVDLLERGVALFPRLEIARGIVGLVKMLAWLRATSPNPGDRDGARAVRLAEAVNAASEHANPLHLDVLAAAYAEAGRFEDARATIDRAIELASAQRPEILPTLRQRQHLYAADRPFHKPR